MKNKGSLAISQIGILVFAIFAFAFLVGGMGVVRGADNTIDNNPACTARDGTCVDENSCTGQIVGGLCPNEASNVKCCIPNIEKLESKSGNIASNVATATLTTGATEGTKAILNKGKEKAIEEVAKTGGKKEVGKIASFFQKTNSATAGKFLLKGLIWATILGVSARYIGEWAGLNVGNAQNLAKNVFVGSIVATLGTKLGLLPFFAGTPVGWIALGGAAIGGLVYAAFFHKNLSQEVVTYECNVWQAPTGGENCELCNQQDFECTEYQCRSMGQGCELVNEGTGEQMCVNTCERDIKSPVVEPLDDALLAGYKYTLFNTISTKDEGVKVTNTESSDGCAPAFTPISFGVETDKPTRCKIDPYRQNSFEEMLTYMDGVNLRYNHSFALSLPSKSALDAENITLENGGEYEVYVRCEDACGNQNIANFVFKYCVDQGPDVTAPLIVSTSILDGHPIAYNTSSLDLDVYVNEPSECKWSHLDLTYDLMENEMTCEDSVSESMSGFLYKCGTTLTGLKDRTDNRIYMRCKDQPWLQGTDEESQRNTNEGSYPLTLKGTQPLVIDYVSPNDEIIKDSTDSIKVTLEARTSAGYDSGKSVCSYAPLDGAFIQFFYGYDVEVYSQYNHEQDLWLSEGDYNYEIKCCDLGGNCDTELINFSVETDTSAPIAVRAFHEDNYLKIITDEEAECVYDTKDCTYAVEDGLDMTNLNDGLEHYTTWDSKKNFYIKCFDGYGNQPNPDECSIIAKPFEV